MPDTNAKEYYNGTGNKAVIVGKIADFKVRTGTTNTPAGQSEYTSISGTVQIGDDASFKVPFQWRKKSIQSDGSINEGYAGFVAWVSTLKSIAADHEGSRVCLVGAYQRNDYVDRQGKFRRGTLVRVWRTDMAPVDKPDYFELDFDGSVVEVNQEKREGKPTGRLEVKVVGLNYARVGVPLTFFVPTDLSNPFGSMYPMGSCGRFFITFGMEMPPESSQPRTGGIGVIRETTGRSQRVAIMTGAEPPFKSNDENYISPDEARDALAAYTAQAKEIQEKGYQGNTTNSAPPRTGAIGARSSNTGDQNGFGFSSAGSTGDADFDLAF